MGAVLVASLNNLFDTTSKRNSYRHTNTPNYIHTYRHTYIHTHTYTYIHMDTHDYTNAYQMYIHKSVHYVRTYILT